ncbi:uncharacterized protein LOC143349053 [Colletes latitarsis]|uniref:uncharacterized protein LOC143349053 n=1 Tax=Colletes latitarsis TaxID=2605962 RepID=UPI0040372873
MVFENVESIVTRKQLKGKERVLSVIVFFHRQVSHKTSTKPAVVLEMYLTPATLYSLRLSLQQGAVSQAVRRNIVERNATKSAFVLATVGLSMSMFSVKKMLSSKHRGRL